MGCWETRDDHIFGTFCQQHGGRYLAGESPQQNLWQWEFC